MEIIKEIKRNDRKNKIRVRIKKGLEIGLKINGSSEMIKGKTLKQSGSYIKIETGRKKKRLVMSIPKRKEIVEDILF